MVALVLLLSLYACSGGQGPAARPAVTTGPATASPSPESPSAASPSAKPPAREPAWAGRSSAPGARQEVATAVLDGRVWVLGGLTASGASARVESYGPAADRWERGPDLPVAVHHAMAAAYRGEIVLVGGFLNPSADAPAQLYGSPSDRVLALRNGAWVDLPRLARPRGAGGAAVVGNSLFVVGGRNGSDLIAPTEVFDGAAWHDAADLPALRDHLAAVADDRFVYAVGGRVLSPSSTSNALERYDPAANAWQRLPDLPTARGGLGAALVGGRIVTAGGEDASQVFAQVEAFDLRTDRWSSLPAMVTPRHGLGAAPADGDDFLALLGGTAAGVAPSAVAEVLQGL